MPESIKKLFQPDTYRENFSALLRYPKTHNYINQHWGWALHMINTTDNGKTYTLCGHGIGIEKGDFILMKMESGKIGKFKIMEIKYFSDPYDMWSGKIRPIGYVEE